MESSSAQAEIPGMKFQPGLSSVVTNRLNVLELSYSRQIVFLTTPGLKLSQG